MAAMTDELALPPLLSGPKSFWAGDKAASKLLH